MRFNPVQRVCIAIAIAQVVSAALISPAVASGEITIAIKDAKAGLLRSAQEDAEVIRWAVQGEQFIAVTMIKNFYLVEDEETESFLYVPFYQAEELDVELPANILVSGRMPMPHQQDLSYWQVAPGKGRRSLMQRRGVKMLTAHNGKKYPAGYDHNMDYSPSVDGRQLLRDAKGYLGAPYVLGGTTKDGIDCSGLTKVCLARQGVDVVHRSSLQALEGRYVRNQELKPGDLVYFRDAKDSRYLSHVGIYLGRSKFIHASQSRGGVVITSLNDKYFKSHYAFARRL